jgi:hypothetical protein
VLANQNRAVCFGAHSELCTPSPFTDAQLSQNNTKQHKTTQNNTKQHKTTQNNTKQHKTTINLLVGHGANNPSTYLHLSIAQR